MSPIDIIVAALPLVIVAIVGLYARRYVRSVADFISANRSAGRYMLCIAGGELQAGAVVFVSSFEVFSHGGFGYGWWLTVNVFFGLLLRIIGFVTYRYRETRAMTLAQFFEIRYNKSFRLFTGLLAFFAGMLNFGVIPAIGARVMVYFLGLPETVTIFSNAIPTYVPLMALFLGATLFVALTGGLITVMVINAIEGIISQLFYLILIGTILWMFSWSQMHAVIMDPVAHPPGHSMVNPFDTARAPDFNFLNIVLTMVTAVIGTMAWQNSIGYSAAAITPHEGRMGTVLSAWREMGKGAVLLLLGLGALTFLRSPEFAVGAAHVHETVSHITDAQAREQMELPVALSYLLPIGVKGVLCAVLFMGLFGGDATHLLSWGSVFVQDVLVPLRKKPFSPKAHLWVLRLSIIGVACWAFVFGSLFHIVDYITMWWGLTQAIFTGGAGAAIIGGLYWKKGTATGAWAGFITGSMLSVAGIITQQYYVHYLHHKFFLNGSMIGFGASVSAVIVYVVSSLLTFREDFNLERMLHRGQYAVVKEAVHDEPIPHRKKPRWGKLMGFDDNFTLGDKWVAGVVYWKALLMVGLFFTGLIWNLITPWQDETWASYFHFMSITLPIFFAVVTGIWFTWGGLRDMRRLFQRLGTEQVNDLDDGTVTRQHENLDEAAVHRIPKK